MFANQKLRQRWQENNVRRQPRIGKAKIVELGAQIANVDIDDIDDNRNNVLVVLGVDWSTALIVANTSKK